MISLNRPFKSYASRSARHEYEEATEWAEKARLKAEKLQRRSARVSVFKNLLPHAFNSFAPSNSRVRSASPATLVGQEHYESTSPKDKDEDQEDSAQATA